METELYTSIQIYSNVRRTKIRVPIRDTKRYHLKRGKHQGSQKEPDKNQHVEKYFYDKKGVENLPKVKGGDEIVIRKDGILVNIEVQDHIKWKMTQEKY
ncbi:hypothetical protein JTB14_015225 [Gonioctena quinquepunctata]|nr:hypothetical protein JTB14_015225 [Gonioctena quinquepunctata]